MFCHQPQQFGNQRDKQPPHLRSHSRRRSRRSRISFGPFSPSLVFLSISMDEEMTVADASSIAGSVDESSIPPVNFPLISAFLAFALGQFLKLFTTWFKEKRWDSKRMLGSGGMPSSHSATVTALAAAIGIQEGIGGSAFALAAVLACIVMYDASGVRLHAGRQAELLNQIVCELPPEHPVSSVKPLRDSLGHTPLQVVAGAILGCTVAYMLKFYG